MKNVKELFLKISIFTSASITIGLLLWIVGFILYNGISKVNWSFLTSFYEPSRKIVSINKNKNYNINIEKESYIKELGITIDINDKKKVIIKSIDSNSPVKKAVLSSNRILPLKVKDEIISINREKVEGKSIKEIKELINSNNKKIYKLKVIRPGGGVYPMIIITLYIIFLALIIATPIGVLSAIYLTEYAKPGRLVNIIRLATESLAGIPSIIYGLFGMIFFSITLNMKYSILSGALTLSIILLPVIIRTTEESLKSVPNSYREASFGLGATKLHTILKAVLPSAIPGILVSIILSIGRIIGESAALLLTAGSSVAFLPKGFKDGGATLTVKAYLIAKEEGNIQMACAIGTVIIIMIIILNTISKVISNKLSKI